jgi:hypothetical protein
VGTMQSCSIIDFDQFLSFFKYLDNYPDGVERLQTQEIRATQILGDQAFRVPWSQLPWQWMESGSSTVQSYGVCRILLLPHLCLKVFVKISIFRSERDSSTFIFSFLGFLFVLCYFWQTLRFWTESKMLFATEV